MTAVHRVDKMEDAREIDAAPLLDSVQELESVKKTISEYNFRQVYVELEQCMMK